MAEALDENDPQNAIIPGRHCKNAKSHPIRKRDEKKDKPGEYYARCTLCRAKDRNWKQDKKGLQSDPIVDVVDNDEDPQQKIIRGRCCQKHKAHPIRKCDEKPNKPGEYYIWCTPCRQEAAQKYLAAHPKIDRPKIVRPKIVKKLPEAVLSLLYRSRFKDRPSNEPSSQPNWPTDDLQSLSQPLAVTSTARTTSPVKRFRSDRDEDIARHKAEIFSEAHTGFAILQPLRKRVFDVLRSRLADAGVDVQGLTVESLVWCLPQQ